MDMPGHDWDIPPDPLSLPLFVSGRPTRILLVENDPVVALDLALTIDELGGAVVDRASSGAVAIAKADRLRPTVVLMDVELDGDMDGIQTARIIQFRAAIPVVFVTGNDDDVTMRRITACNAKRVPKPVSSTALVRAILESLEATIS